MILSYAQSNLDVKIKSDSTGVLTLIFGTRIKNEQKSLSEFALQRQRQFQY